MMKNRYRTKSIARIGLTQSCNIKKERCIPSCDSHSPESRTRIIFAINAPTPEPRCCRTDCIVTRLITLDQFQRDDQSSARISKIGLKTAHHLSAQETCLNMRIPKMKNINYFPNRICIQLQNLQFFIKQSHRI